MKTHDLHLVVWVVLSQQLEEQGTGEFRQGVCRTGSDSGIGVGMDGAGGDVEDELL
jgi:hypothetical protein